MYIPLGMLNIEAGRRIRLENVLRHKVGRLRTIVTGIETNPPKVDNAIYISMKPGVFFGEFHLYSANGDASLSIEGIT